MIKLRDTSTTEKKPALPQVRDPEKKIDYFKGDTE